MNSRLQTYQSTEHKITALHLGLFAAALPFDRFYSQLLLISLVLHTIIHLKKQRLSTMPWQLLLPAISVFLLTVATTAWSAYRKEAFPFWERQSAILIIPILLALSAFPVHHYRRAILRGFSLVITGVILYLFIDALRVLHYYHQPFRQLFTYAFLSHNFSAPLDLHATYLSLFAALSLAIILNTLLSNEPVKRPLRAALIMAVPVLVAGLVQLASRAVLISMGTYLLLVLPFLLQKEARRKYLLVAILSISTIGAVIWRSDSLHQRLVSDLRQDLGDRHSAASIADPRGQRWELAARIALRKPILGHGTGSEVPLLMDAYYENRLFDSYLNELNAHNQYLSFAIRGGILTLLAYIGTLFYFFRQAIRRRDALFLCFVLLFAGTGLSENLLDVNKGIFFYAFFVSFFVFGAQEKNASFRKRSNQQGARFVFIHKHGRPNLS